MALEESLDLDISQALSRIDDVETALGSAASGFATALAEATAVLSNLSVENVDASAVTTSIDEAVTAAQAEPVVVDADTSQITPSIDDAVAAAQPGEVPVDADTGTIADSIDQAVAGATPEPIEVPVDEGSITDSIDSALGSVDTSGVTDQLDALGGAGSAAGVGLGDASKGLEAIGPLAGFAAGDMAGLTEATSGLVPEAAAATGAFAGLAAAGKELFDRALEQQTALERLNRTFGETAEDVQRVDVGGLNEDISALALRTGSADEGLQNFAASFGQLGISAGVAAPQVASTVDQIIALATRASVLNPTLGSSDEIVGRLSTSLSRGGRFLGQFGIALTAAEINARALADTGKASAADLTVYEKSAAGAALATEKLGNQLGKDINEGAKADAIQLRSLKTALDETLEAAGAGLVRPVIDDLKALEPALADITTLFGTGLGAALSAITPEVEAVAGALTDVSGAVAFLTGGTSGDALKGFFTDAIPGAELFTGLQAFDDLLGFGASAADKQADAAKKAAAAQNQQSHEALIAAVSNGQLNRELEVSAIRQHTNKDGTVDWTAVLKQLGPTIDASNVALDQYGNTVAKVAPAQQSLTLATQALAQAQLEHLVSTGRLSQAQLDANVALHTGADGTKDYSAALKELDPTLAGQVDQQGRVAAGLGDVRTGFERAGDAADTFKTALDAALGIFVTADEAAIRSADAEDKLTKALQDSAGSLDIKTEKGRAAARAFDDLLRADQAVIDAQVRESNGTITAAQARDNLITKLREEEARYPALRGQIDGYITKILAIPPEQLTQTGLPNAGPSITSADEVRAAIESIPPDRRSTITVDTLSAIIELNKLHDAQLRVINAANAVGNVPINFSRFVSGRAMAGGTFGAWEPVWVGEGGPELITVPAPFQVHTHEESKRMAQGGPIIGQVQIFESVNGQAAAAALENRLAPLLRTN